MILDLKKIRQKGKDSEEFSFEYNPEAELCNIPNVKLAPPVKVNGEVTITGKRSCYLDFDVEFTLIGECTRCLEKSSRSYFVTVTEELEEGEEDSYPIKSDTVSLDRITDDYIIMNLPVNFLCKDDCKGICAVCGANRNLGECKCEKQ